MGMGVTGGAARYSDYADAANYVYTIYVKNSDLARAKELLGLRAPKQLADLCRGTSAWRCVFRCGTDLILVATASGWEKENAAHRAAFLIKCAGPRPRWPSMPPP